MSKFEKKFTLQQNEYLSSIIGEMEVSDGVTAIVASVGSGKTTDFVNKPDVMIAVPLIAIKQSEIDKGANNIFTWQAAVLKVQASNKLELRNKTLVVDEAHGLYMDFNYKPGAIRDLIGIFQYFKSVVIMTGTASPEYFNSFPITRAYSVYKPQRADKILSTYLYDKNGKAALESFIHSRIGQRKAIALVNNKSDCNQFVERYGDRALIVNADEKMNDDVLELYASRLMGDKWDIIFGTNSIREGLSIEDKLDEVDIFIFGHTDPDVIEQFTNRFRNVSGVKHVHYFVSKSEVREIADFDIEAFTDNVSRFGSLLNDFYKSEANDDNYREYLRSAYNSETKGSHLRYDKESDSFEVDLISIDGMYYEHRKKQILSDPVLFESKMMDYDFSINPTRVISGDSQIAQDLKDGKRVIKDKQQSDRKERLSTITESFSSGVFEYTGDEEYDYVVDSIRKLLKKGLHQDQIAHVIDGVIEDKEYIRKRVWPDFNYVDLQSNIRNQILYYIAKECPDDELHMMDTGILANMAIGTTLKEFFMNDEVEMKKNKEWRSLVEWRGGQLVPKDGCEVKIINRYITLGKRKDKRVSASTDPVLKAYLNYKGKDRYQVYPVKYTNLSGLEIEKIEPSNVVEFAAKTEATISVLQERLLALRAVA
ncbi:hypothetical protein GKQ23_13125 [Erwinia sp. E602]|uniref:hypothetical protein n=1 Tax=Erwinia sp. E602 TaxID=2675378 RepID=UPI001BAC2F81|nr:hypothetical protein [Erwinia sp. E602]QUG75876.1 hypothetical protein GKQ23_13125 [Erwinia sp. E602]